MAEDESGFRPPDDEPEGIRLVGPTDPPLKFPERGTDDTTALPHWSEPATGEMPRMLFDEEPTEPDQELEAWSSFAATPRWRSSADDWDDDTDLSELGDSETRVGALDSSRDDRADVFVFDDTTEPPTDPAPAVTPIRTGTRSSPPAAPAAAASKTTTARKHLE
jgi:phosphatidate cytidylyltransferase